MIAPWCRRQFSVIKKMVPTLKLSNGKEIPVMGLGTSQAKPGEMEQAVKYAIDLGYRNFDSAMIYTNEHEIGAGIRAKIKEGVIKREDVFVTNKLWNTFQRRDLVVPACRRTLEAMGLDYLDLYLIHFPLAMKEGNDLWPKDEEGEFIESDSDYVDTWKGMEECVKQGLTRSIGISNFNSEQIKRILDVATIKPVVNQVECHPYLNQSKLIKFCNERGILVTAYAPFGRPSGSGTGKSMKVGAPPLLQDQTLQKIAAKYNKTVAQIILRYLIQHGVVPIPKSSNKKRMEENINVFDFELSSTDVLSINALDHNNRLFTYPVFLHFKNYPFHIEY